MSTKIDNGYVGSNTKNTYMVINWVLTKRKPNGAIYASLYDSVTENLIISATIEYIINAAKARDYIVDNAQGILFDIANNGMVNKISVSPK